MVDTMRNEQKNQSYLAVNPTGSIPMVTDGGYKVLGGSQVLLNYICNSQKNIKEMLYPAEMTNDIQKYFSWFQALMKPASQRLIKMHAFP
mmetsp:Transcript_13737/g.13450  ORF Transcript_13737/g.13450 Transcript_13737/m.13450 type:complete len:90 (-) Transcript_13737:344-613(-)